MELVTQEGDTVTIKFRATEVVDLIRITSAAAQAYDDLDIELLDHLTGKEVSTLSDDLVHLVNRNRQNV